MGDPDNDAKRREEAAFAILERLLWANGPVCPHCGESERHGRVFGRGARIALWFCHRCRRQFRATIGTPFEGSHVPLRLWFLTAQLRRHGAYAAQIQKATGVRYRTAHRMVKVIDANPEFFAPIVDALVGAEIAGAWDRC